MAYLGSLDIDDYITFYANSHATTGVATDADGVPPWRIYEDETGAAITTGNMALLDAANTAGFYSERLQLLAATGFEQGKQYAVYISMTVGGIEGTMHHTFQIGAKVDTTFISEDRTAADNLELACDNYSVTRGLTGTALPAVAAAANGGLVTGDGNVTFTAGVGNRPAVDVEALGGTVQSATDLKDFADAGYDPVTDKVQGVVLVDTTTTNTDMAGTNNAALAATALTDATWTDARAGYLDELAAANLPTDIADIPTVAEFNARTIPSADYFDPATDAVANVTLVATTTTNTDMVTAAPTAVQNRQEMDNNSTELAKIGTIPALDGAGQTIGAAIAKLADDNGGADFDAGTDSLQEIRDRGDAAWTTGGGASITDILNIYPAIPNSIDLANTATVRLALGLTNALDDLPTTVEITPGTITIDRKAIGGAGWINVVNAAACSEAAGLVYYDEVFDAGAGYAAGDSIRVTFKSQKITVAANDYDITDATGWIFQTYIREAMAGTDGAALAATALSTAQWTNTRAAYLDELAAANIPADIDTLLARITAAVALASVCTEARLAELDAANLPADIADIPTVAEFNARTLVAAGYFDPAVDTVANVTTVATTTNLTNAPTNGDLTATMKTSVNVEVADVLKTDTIAEIAQGIPPATPTIEEALMYLYMALRGKIDVTSTFKEFHNDAGTVVWKKALSDDGTTYSEAKGGSGP